jgi:hypothetical protein
MRNIRLVFALVLTVFVGSSAAGQAGIGPFENSIPLKTDRASIERDHRVTRVGSNWIEFDSSEGKVIAEFAKSNCDSHGWNVDPDTLVTLSVFPRDRTAFENVNVTGFDSMAWESEVYYADRAKGIEYQIRRDYDGQYLGAIRRVPKTSDSALRCDGFPEYDPLSEHYTNYDGGIITRIGNWDVTRVFTTIENARANSKRAFIFVYCPGNESRTAHKIIAKINRFVQRLDRSNPDYLTVAYGGVRSRCEFESFVIPSGYPEVRPRPKAK